MGVLQEQESDFRQERATEKTVSKAKGRTSVSLMFGEVGFSANRSAGAWRYVAVTRHCES